MQLKKNKENIKKESKRKRLSTSYSVGVSAAYLEVHILLQHPVIAYSSGLPILADCSAISISSYRNI